jgi:hypothetical protein
MTKQDLIEKSVKYLNVLPENKIEEVVEYIEFLILKYDDVILQKGITKLNVGSNSFEFLKDEEDLYSLSDIKENYK